MVSIDYLFLKNKFDDLIQCLDRIDQAVGGDPYLNVLRGNAHAAAGRFAAARTAHEAAIKAEPDLTEAYTARISLALMEKNHEDTLKWLKAVVEQRGIQIKDLTKVPEYAEFVTSPQYPEFKQWYAERQK
jgi:tetratricopeptide (TPR) repeat protein